MVFVLILMVFSVHGAAATTQEFNSKSACEAAAEMAVAASDKFRDMAVKATCVAKG